MPSIGQDLARVRKEKQFTIEEIHSLTKIPLVTLKSIEDDSLFENASEQHQTYIRSFVRSYGKAIKIPDDVLVKALDDYYVGTYDNEILVNQGITPKSAPLFELNTETQASEEVSEETEEAEETTEEASKVTESKKADYHSSPKPPTVDSVDWVNMGKKFSDPEVKSRIWIISIAGVFIITIVILMIFFGGGLWESITGGNDEQASITPPIKAESIIDNNNQIDGADPVITDSLFEESTEETETIAPVVSTGPQTIGDTLKVQIYAAYDILEPVRVTSDYTWRTDPFWIEMGQAVEFDFSDTLLVRGQYSRMVLLMNGHVIENFRQRYFDVTYNSVMLTRSIFEGDPRYEEPSPVPFPLEVGPPQSVIKASSLR